MSRQRAEELLAFRAAGGLDEAERRELERLLGEHPELDDGGFETAAAACHLALLGAEEPLPEECRRRLEREAAIFRGDVVPLASRQAAPDRQSQTEPDRVLEPSSRSRVGWLAAAACLLLAVVGWWPRLMAPPSPPQPAPPVVAERPPPSPAEAPDAFELPWQATEDEAATSAAGAVVWSTSRQAGFMRIRGLAPNDPSVSQYQLWIFDKNRDDRYPVDGGVFDMPAGAAEAVVPIDAKVAVDEPVLFAITVERPGGVVVSGRERIVLLAQRQA